MRRGGVPPYLGEYALSLRRVKFKLVNGLLVLEGLELRSDFVYVGLDEFVGLELCIGACLGVNLLLSGLHAYGGG